MAYERDLTPDETMPDEEPMPSDADLEDTPLENLERATEVTDAGDLGF